MKKNVKMYYVFKGGVVTCWFENSTPIVFTDVSIMKLIISSNLRNSGIKVDFVRLYKKDFIESGIYW